MLAEMLQTLDPISFKHTNSVTFGIIDAHRKNKGCRRIKQDPLRKIFKNLVNKNAIKNQKEDPSPSFENQTIGPSFRKMLRNSL